MRDVEQLTAGELPAACGEPGGELASVQFRVAAQGRFNKMQDATEKVGFIGGIGSADRMYDPIGTAGCQHFRPARLQRVEQFASGAAVAGGFARP